LRTVAEEILQRRSSLSQLLLLIQNSAMSWTRRVFFTPLLRKGGEYNGNGHTPSEREPGQSAQAVPQKGYPFGNPQHGPQEALVCLQNLIAPDPEEKIHPQIKTAGTQGG
jgi:hypothetical protein